MRFANCPSPSAQGREDRCGWFSFPQRCGGRFCVDGAVHRVIRPSTPEVTMPTPDIEAAREAVIAAADAYDDGHASWGTAKGKDLAAAIRTLRAALAPPLPERRRWIVETEDRPAEIGEAFLYPADYTMKGQTIGKCNTVSPAIVHAIISVARDLLDGYVPDANTVTLKPGQYVVKPTQNAEPGTRYLDGQCNLKQTTEHDDPWWCLAVVCEYTPPTTESSE